MAEMMDTRQKKRDVLVLLAMVFCLGILVGRGWSEEELEE